MSLSAQSGLRTYQATTGFTVAESIRLSPKMQRQTGHHWRRPGLWCLKTGTAKPVGDFGGGTGAGFAEEPEEQIHQATNLSNLAGAILPNQLPKTPGGNRPDKMANRSSRFSGTIPSFIGCPFTVVR